MHKKLIQSHEAHIAVWGLGTIGFSSMVYFAQQGVRVVGYDFDSHRVETINDGKVPVDGMSSWLEADVSALVASGLLRATNIIDDVLSPHSIVHLIGVPTERGGIPHSEIVSDVVHRIAASVTRGGHAAPPIVIVESTMIPGTSEDILAPLCEELGLRVGKDIHIAASPRRDWFKDGGYFLRGLDRVFGGLTPQCSKVTREVLEIVCDKLHQASAIKIAEITKVVENAYRFIEISLANQLSLGFPDIDMVEVLNLAATKWNMGHFHPSLGPGGHCVPVAPRHLLMAATVPSELSLIERAVSGRLRVADDVLKDVLAIQPQSVLVLGLSYRADVKMAVLSASIPLAQGFADSGVDVICFDPYFPAHEVRALVKGSIAGSQDDLGRPQVVVLCTDHGEFLSGEFIQSIVDMNPILVVDNTGRWESVAWSKTTHYARVGTGALRRMVQDELSKYEELSVAV